jgi:hypothetical protein
MDEFVISKEVANKLKSITPFIDYNTISRIFNKLTDYAEVIQRGNFQVLLISTIDCQHQTILNMISS